MGAPGLHLRIPGLTIGTWPVLAALELDFAPGQTTVLLGPSGSGKSSLLRLVAGLLPMPAGAVLEATDAAPVRPRLIKARAIASASPIATATPPSHAATASAIPPLPAKLTTGTPDTIASSATVGILS